MEQNAEPASPVRETLRTLPTPFLTKTYQLVDDKNIDDVISWNEDGSTFVVWNPSAFATDLLPKYFKHNNFSSFVRQLNTYGFRKVVTDRWEFSNECFRKGEKRLLRDIQRRKMSSISSPLAVAAAAATVSPGNSGEEQVLSSNSSQAKHREVSCSGATDLIDENERLRKENLELIRELSQIRNLCSNVYALMSNYAFDSSSSPSAEPLDLLPMKRCFEHRNGYSHVLKGREETSSARLFGVPIGPKRSREGHSNSNVDRVVKQEP